MYAKGAERSKKAGKGEASQRGMFLRNHPQLAFASALAQAAKSPSL